MSTLPPKADKAQTCLHVRFVPIAAVSNRSKKNTRSPRRRRQAAQAARSGRAHARRLVVKLAAETPEMGKFPVNFPVSREFGAETGSHPTASSGTLNTAQCIPKHCVGRPKKGYRTHGLYREASQRFINGRDW